MTTLEHASSEAHRHGRTGWWGAFVGLIVAVLIAFPLCASLAFAAGPTWQPLGALRVHPRPAGDLPLAAPPPTAAPVGVRFGDALGLVAADLPDQAAWLPGDSIPFTLYWEAVGSVADRVKVFVHLTGELPSPTSGSDLWAQQDQEPGGDALPATAWRPGEVIADSYRLPIPLDAPPGRYALRVGLYLPLDWQRLPAAAPDGRPLGDSVTLLEITVVPR